MEGRQGPDAVMSTTLVPNVDTFGALMRKIRIARGMSLRAFAKRIGYSPSYMHDVESGSRPPIFGGSLTELLQALGCTENERFDLVVAEAISRGTLDLSGINIEDVPAIVAMRDGLRDAAQK